MTKNKIFIPLFLNISIVAGLIFFSYQIKSNLVLPEINIDPEKDEINFHEDFYKVVNLGQKRMISSLLWTHTMLFGDAKHVQWKKGEVSWMYHRFNTISLIDPLFYENYLFGGKYLNIVKYDVYGSESLLKKGIRTYPDSIDIGFQLGFNLIFDQKKKKDGLSIWRKFLNHSEIKEKYALLPYLISRFLEKNSEKVYIDILKFQYNKLPSDSPLKEFYLQKIKKARRKSSGFSN